MIVRLNVTGYWPDGAKIPLGHVCTGSTVSFEVSSLNAAVALLDALDPRPVNYSIISQGEALEGSRDPFLRTPAEPPSLESFV